MNISFPQQLKHPAVITAASVIGFFCLLWILVHSLIDKEAFAKRLMESVYGVTGYKAHAGAVDIEFFPQPTVILERFEVDNHAQASTANIFVAERVEVTLNLMRLMTGHLRPGVITLVRPVVELEVFRDRTTNWDFLERFNISNMPPFSPSGLVVEGGTVNLNDTFIRQIRQFDAINIDFSFDESTHDVDLDAEFRAFQRNIKVGGIFTAKAFSSLSQYSFDLDLDIKDEENHVIYKGTVGQDREGLNYDGVFSFEFVNVVPWIEVFFTKEANDGIFQNLTEPMPMQISGKAKAQGTKFAFTDITMQSETTSGKGRIISDANVFPQTQAAFHFNELDMGALVDPKRAVTDKAFNSFIGRFLPQDVSASVDFQADHMVVAGVNIENAVFMATLDSGEMVINQAALHMAGDTELLVFGIIKHSLDDAVHFDGNMELIGKRMLDFAHAFGFDKDKFVTDHDGEFRAKASMFLSRANSIISDFKLQAGTLLASGGMTAGTGEDIDREFTLRVSGIKLDPFAALMVPTSKKDMQKSDFEDILRRLTWMDKVKNRTKINLVLQNYTLSKTLGKQSTMHLFIEPGRLKFQDTSFELGGIVFSGGFIYDQREEVPAIEADMTISSFNIEPFTARNLRKDPVPRDNYQTVWSEEFFSFGYLKGYNSKLDLRFNRIQHPDFPMSNVHLSAVSTNGKWEVKALRANLWDGTLKISGSLNVTSIPSLAFSFALENIESVRLFEAFAGHDNFLGKLSLNGQVSTSGINTHNWIKNARGTFVALGQNLVVKGFDVASLVQAIPSVRTVADVVNTARVSMLRQHTTFSVVEGGFYLENGTLKSTELKLRAKHSIGVVKGEMDLTTWMMNCAIDFGLVSLARGDYPSITIRFVNSMDNPVIELDTRSLESFIARKYLR